MNRLLLIVPVLAALLAGCTNSGIQCTSDEVRCGNACANLTHSQDHCGACGVACATNFVCQNSQCVCPTPQTACGQACVNTQTDPANCGGCGHVCPANNVCNDSQCVQSCPVDKTLCGGSCIDTISDSHNCGGCNVVCPAGQSCHNSHCASDLYAACENTGGVHAIDATSEVVSSDKALAPPNNPESLAFFDVNTLFVADSVNASTIYKFNLNVDGGFLADATTYPGSKDTATLVIEGTKAYAVNSSEGNLDIFDVGAGNTHPFCSDGGAVCDHTLTFPANSYPEKLALTPDKIVVALQGDVTSTNATPGNSVAVIDRNTLTLQEFPIAADATKLQATGTFPHPFGIAVQGNRVFVSLQNISVGASSAYGPGLVAVFDLLNGTLTPHGDPIALGSGCFNAGAVLLAGNRLYVACGPKYNADYSLAAPGALAALDTTSLQPAFAPQVLGCAPGVSAASCSPGSPWSLALAAGKLFIGDSNNGRIFIADPTTGTIQRGPANALEVCIDPSYNIVNLASRPF